MHSLYDGSRLHLAVCTMASAKSTQGILQFWWMVSSQTGTGTIKDCFRYLLSHGSFWGSQKRLQIRVNGSCFRLVVGHGFLSTMGFWMV